MSSDYFNLKIFTPVGLALEAEVTEVSMPSKLGEIGVLTAHTKFTGLLGSGVLKYTVAATHAVNKVAISEGFCTFADSTMTILADFIAVPGDVVGDAYASERGSLQSAVNSISAFDPEWQVAKDKLARIEAIDALLK